jgi:hypothetical protein
MYKSNCAFYMQSLHETTIFTAYSNDHTKYLGVKLDNFKKHRHIICQPRVLQRSSYKVEKVEP